MGTLNLTLSQKQIQLRNQIIAKNVTNISVLGSTQSGKTFDICYSIIEYAERLYKFAPDEKFNGGIIGWTTDTIKRNIYDVIVDFFKQLGIAYISKFNQMERYIEIYNIRFYFFGFNTYLSFNKILGAPLIFVWIDEAARIYSQLQLQATFDEIPGRQISYVGHPYKKTIHSFNVEGGENHPYKIKYIDNSDAVKFVFFPYDNPKIKTKEQIAEVIKTFPPGPLRQQKIFNKWVVAEGKVFNKINIIDSLKDITIREIGVGVDYGSVNATTFVPIALAYHRVMQEWILIRLPIYYHDSNKLGTKPTTEFFSKQLRLFLVYLKSIYLNIPIYDLTVDSEATHFVNRLINDNIKCTAIDKPPGSVDEGVQLMQSLFDKDYLYVLKGNSIEVIYDNNHIQFSGKDDGYLEYQNYQYDKIRSIREGINCYKKEYDHSVDATRYILRKWVEKGKCPLV